jgi:hypothetical protein
MLVGSRPNVGLRFQACRLGTPVTEDRRRRRVDIISTPL